MVGVTSPYHSLTGVPSTIVRLQRLSAGQQLSREQKACQRSNGRSHTDCENVCSDQSDPRPASQPLQTNPWPQVKYGCGEEERDYCCSGGNDDHVDPCSTKSLKADQHDSTQHAQHPSGEDEKEWHNRKGALCHIWQSVLLVGRNILDVISRLHSLTQFVCGSEAFVSLPDNAIRTATCLSTSSI